MNKVVKSTFSSMMEFLPEELKAMPIIRWNESVFRYFFCKHLAKAHPDVEQFLESSKIDLVLSHKQKRAFVEFKFYLKPDRFDPYDGTKTGLKGGPGLKNLAEFRACIDQLHEREIRPGLSKFVILAYTDRPGSARVRHTYKGHYEKYQHPTRGVLVRELIRAEPITTEHGDFHARLYAVD